MPTVATIVIVVGRQQEATGFYQQLTKEHPLTLDLSTKTLCHFCCLALITGSLLIYLELMYISNYLAIQVDSAT